MVGEEVPREEGGCWCYRTMADPLVVIFDDLLSS